MSRQFAMRASVTASNRAWRSPKRPYRRVPAGRSPRPVLCCRRRPRGLVGPTRPAASRGVNRLRAPLLLRPKERPGSGQRHRARSNVRRVCTRRSAGAAGASLKVIGGIRATVLGSANRLAATKPFQLARLSARRRHRWHENSCTAPNRKKRASLALGYRCCKVDQDPKDVDLFGRFPNFGAHGRGTLLRQARKLYIGSMPLPDLTALPSLRRPEPRRLLCCHLSSDICV
jgi:hypothetical protein